MGDNLKLFLSIIHVKIKSFVELYGLFPEDERKLTGVLRRIAIDSLNGYGKEKFSWNVPFFYGNKSICLIWPASVPQGGIKVQFLVWKPPEWQRWLFNTWNQ